MYTSTADAMTVSLVEMAAGATIPLHQHPHEQVGMMLEGEAEFTIGGETRRVVAGDRWHIPGNMPHSVTALEKPVRAVDVFYPIRDDYR
jgi:quercetin dioxygenase-like cupin family protein